MLDPLVSVSLSIFEGKGVYVPLLGSGISHAAGIPTGWEILLDLIRKVAAQRGEEPDDPASWYRTTFGTEPLYDRLLEELASLPSERLLILRQYFEPTTEEREQGLKVPTSAHNAIAELVRDGYLRVILTTNFDRLMEQALEAHGVPPIVITSPDAINGALPLPHARVTVVKLHGDYLDTRLRNSPTELETYDPATNALLDRIIDEYGLLIIGWSGLWDIALRRAIERASNRRFTTFFCCRGPLPPPTKTLADFRGFKLVEIGDANAFFSDLISRIRALETSGVHPLSGSLAIAAFKRLLDQPGQRVRRAELIAAEALTAAVRFAEERRTKRHQLSAEEGLEALARYEHWLTPLRELLALGCYWSDDEFRTCANVLAVVGRAAIDELQDNDRTNLIRYGPAYLYYVGGIAALAHDNFRTFGALSAIDLGEPGRAPKDFLLLTQASEVFRPGVADRIFGQRYFTPMSERLFTSVRGIVHEFCPTDAEYDRLFDRLEYLATLIAVDRQLVRDEKYLDLRYGRYVWKIRNEHAFRIELVVADELLREESSWAPLRAGLFGGSIDRVRAAILVTDEHLDKIRQSLPL